MNQYFTRFALLIAICFSLVAFTSPAYAQAELDKKISLEFEQADVREVLRALFKPLDVSYTIDADIQGQVTLNLKNVLFETALQNITRQVDATYRVEGGVYRIIKREAPGVYKEEPTDTTTKKESKPVRRIKIRSADPMFIAMLLSGVQNYQGHPEMSTILNTPNGAGNSGGMGSGQMGGGMMGQGMGSGQMGQGMGQGNFGGSQMGGSLGGNQGGMQMGGRRG